MIVHRKRSEEKQFGYRRDGREASPYLVAHRRIIDVIRIMYPRTTGERGEGGKEKIGEGDAYLYSLVYRRAVRVQRERQRRRHETFAPDRGVPILLSSSFPNLRYRRPRIHEVYRQAHVLRIILFSFFFSPLECEASASVVETIRDYL